MMPVKTFQIRSDDPSNYQILNIFDHPHQLLVKSHLFEWLGNMLLCHACQQENCSERNLVCTSFMFDGPKRAGTKFDLIGKLNLM